MVSHLSLKFHLIDDHNFTDIYLKLPKYLSILNADFKFMHTFCCSWCHWLSGQLSGQVLALAGFNCRHHCNIAKFMYLSTAKSRGGKRLKILSQLILCN